MAIRNATPAIGNDRIHIARKASWEIEALMDCVLRELADTEGAIAARSIAVRAKELACIQMNALSDDPDHLRESCSDLRKRLTGQIGAEAEVAHD